MYKLGLHGVLQGPEERLDPKMLLDPPKEQFHLPPLFVKQGDALRGKGEIVGQENQVLFVLEVEEPDPAEFVGVMLNHVDSRQGDGLVGTHAGRLVDGFGIHATIPQVLFGPGDEEGQAKGKSMEPFEVEIPSIHHVIRPGFGNQLVEDMHVVPLPVGDLDERGDVPPQIQEGVEFDGRLPLPESRPRKEGEAQVDCCGVESIHRLFQFHGEGIVGVQIPGDPDQDLGEVGVDSPVAVLVGMGQRVPGDPSPDAHVIQLGANGSQAGLDVSQAFPERQLREDGLAVVHGPSFPDRNGHRIPGR